MAQELCQGCKQPLDICYYNGDCLEVQAIYREQQKEKLRDLDLSDEEAWEYNNRHPDL